MLVCTPFCCQISSCTPIKRSQICIEKWQYNLDSSTKALQSGFRKPGSHWQWKHKDNYTTCTRAISYAWPLLITLSIARVAPFDFNSIALTTLTRFFEEKFLVLLITFAINKHVTVVSRRGMFWNNTSASFHMLQRKLFERQNKPNDLSLLQSFLASGTVEERKNSSQSFSVTKSMPFWC